MIRKYGKGSGISKPITLLLIMLLIIIPFLSHTGYDGRSKANAGKVSAVITRGISSVPNAIEERGIGGSNKIVLRPVNDSASWVNVEFDKDMLEVSLRVGNNTTASDGNPVIMDYTDSLANAYKCFVVGYEMGYVINKTPADVLEDSAIKPLGELSNEMLQADDVVAIYAKPVIGKVTYADDLDTAIDRNTIPESGYSLVNAYVLKNQSYDIENKLSIKAFDGTDYVNSAVSGTVYGNVCAFTEAHLPAGYVGEIKYAFEKKSNYENAVSSNSVNSLSWGAAMPFVMKQTTVSSDGEYVVVLGYFVDSTGDGINDTIVDYRVSNSVSLDVTGPEVSTDVRLSNSISGPLAGYSETEKKYYVNSSNIAKSSIFVTGKASVSIDKKIDASTVAPCDCEEINDSLHRFTLGSQGAGTYIITAKDEYDNTTVRQIDVLVDSIVPVIDVNSIKAGTVALGGEGVPISGSNILYFNATDDSNLPLTCHVDIMPDSVGDPIQSDNAKYDSSLGCYYLEMQLDGPGVYDIIIQAKDIAGNPSVPVGVRFRYDNSRPIIKAPILQYSEAGTPGEWNDIPESCIVDNTYVVNPADHFNYSFIVEVEEDNIDTVKLGDKAFSKIDELSLGDITYWRYIITEGDLSLCDDKTPLIFSDIVAIDEATNSATAQVPTKLLMANTKLKIDEAVLVDKDGNIVSLADISDTKYTNEKFTVKAWISSGYDINKTSLIYNENGTEKEYKVIASGIENSTDDISRRRSAVVSFDIFKGTDVNKILNNMYLCAYDVEGQEAKTSVFTLFLDKTYPELVTDPKEAPTEWIQYPYSFDALIKPGDMSDLTVPESGIADGASYVIKGSAGADINQEVETTLDDKGISVVKETVDVPVSKDVVGTSMSFLAKDKAGNQLKENQFIVKVDGDDPVVEGVNVVNTKEKNIGPLSKDLNVFVTVSDLLTLDKIEYQIVKTSDGSIVDADDNVKVNADKEIGKEKITKEIQVCTLKGLANDRYEVRVTVYDKAGHKGELEIPYVFTADNTNPIVRDNSAENKGKEFVIENKWYQSYNFDYIISPGANYLEEESISKASYTVSREEGNEKTVPIYNIVTDGADRGCAVGNVNLPESLTVEGTKISFYAEDNAGNIIEAPNTFVVKVDKSKPVVEDLWIDNTTTNDIFTGLPTIHSVVSDNLSLDKVVLKVTYPDGNTVKMYEQLYELDGEQRGIVKNIDYILETIGESVPDGEYVATVYAVDKAGNNADTLSYTFYIDNTKPRVRYEDGTEVVSDGVWYSDTGFIKKYLIDSGADSDQTKLVSASYSITGSVNDKNISLIQGASLNKILTHIDVPESKEVSGTQITFTAADQANNEATCSVVYKLDKHNPVINKFTVNEQIGHSVPISSIPVIDVEASDNLSLKKAIVEVTMPDGTVTSPVSMLANGSIESENITIKKNYHITELIGMPNVPDGNYSVRIYFEDMSGRNVERVIGFEVDNTVPFSSIAVRDGVTANKAPVEGDRDYYYRSSVDVGFACVEKNFNASKMLATDNGNKLNVNWQNSNGLNVSNAIIESEGLHEIALQGKDSADNPSNSRSIKFIIDKTKPTVSLSVNGHSGNYDSSGALELLGDATVSVSVQDTNEDKDDLNVLVSKKIPDRDTQRTEIKQTSNRSFSFTEEADYNVDVYAVDMAGNISDTRGVNFRIDKTAPNLTISGIGAAGIASNAVTVSFNMVEAFWWDATGEISIYHKPGDGSEERLLKTIEYKPTGYQSSHAEALTETGTYRLEFSGKDKVGHTASTNQTFTIDRDGPVIKLSGVNNYDVTDLTVGFMAEILDDFYTHKIVKVSGTRKDMYGVSHDLEFNAYNAGANPTIISQNFEADGIYDVQVSSTDIAGNITTKSVHFTIDKTTPIIGDLSKYDGMYLKSFDWTDDLEDLVLDLTVCDIHMYLNGSEYDGVSNLEDGSYTLLITAEDELGHYVEKSVEFTLDQKAPVFIVTGVENHEIKDEPYTIDISLQLDEDSLESVVLNEQEMIIKNNVCQFEVTEKGEYALAMKASDPAGNESSQLIRFRYGEKEQNDYKWIIITGIGLVLALMILLVIKSKMRKNN